MSELKSLCKTVPGQGTEQTNLHANVTVVTTALCTSPLLL